MRKNILVAMIVGLLIGVTGCSQQMAREFGGTHTVDLDPGLKLEEITWKNDDLWYLTRPMRDDEVAETHHFSESSLMGVMEGEVIVVEHNVGE